LLLPGGQTLHLNGYVHQAQWVLTPRGVAGIPGFAPAAKMPDASVWKVWLVANIKTGEQVILRWCVEETTMSPLPIDVDTRVSLELSEFIESRVNDPDAMQPITLASVRADIAQRLGPDTKEAERLHHFDDGESLLNEIDALIDEYGGDVLAFDFVQAKASEELTAVIEAVANDENRENPPTLENVREAVSAGLAARLVGEGVMEDDEDQTLLAELDELIDRFGVDTPAEVFLRYE
jgi:hypothetical protein